MGDLRFIVMALLLGGTGIFVFLRPDLAKTSGYDHPINHSPRWLIRLFGIFLVAISCLLIREYIVSSRH